jgi:lipid-A-disaccharide synthase
VKKVFLVSGETSGDQHTAQLILQLKSSSNLPIHFLGMGGPKMKAAGGEIIVSSKKLAVVGIIEIFSALPRLLKAFWILKKRLLTEKPDLVILIDYPGFNLRFAKKAKKAGCKVLYYIPPQLWAWGASRIQKIQKYVDEVCVIFPFEEAFYKKQGVKATFVGHPLVHKVKPSTSITNCKKRLGLNHNKYPIIGLLPGSRKSEIQSLLAPVLLPFAQKMHEKYSNVQFILPIAANIEKKYIQEIIAQHPQFNILLVADDLYDALSTCDLIVAASGTVTLECALLEIPTLLIYKFHPLTYWIGKKLVKEVQLGICNVIAQKEVMKEFVQENARPESIQIEAERLLEDKNAYRKAQKDLKEIKAVLAQKPSKPLSECVLQLIS